MILRLFALLINIQSKKRVKTMLFAQFSLV